MADAEEQPLVARVARRVYGAALVLMGFPRLAQLPVGNTFIQAADLVFLAATALWALAVARREAPLPSWRVLAPSALLAVAGLISLVATPSLRMSAVKLVALGYLVAIMVLTASWAATRPGLLFALRAWTLGAGLTGLLGCLSILGFYAGIRDRAVNIFLWNYGSVPSGSYPRIVVFFLNANMLSNYLLVGVAAAAALAALTEGLERRLALGALASMCISSVFTLSTGLGALGLFVGIGLVAYLRWQGRRSAPRAAVLLGGAAAGALGLALITVFLLVPKGQGDVRLGPVDLSFETSGRVDNWTSSARTFAAHPLTGAGLGVLVSEVTHVRALNTTDQIAAGGPLVTAPRKMEAHNVWLSLAGQLGLLGLASFGWLVVEATKATWVSGKEDRPARDVRLAVLLGLASAIGYHGLFGAFEDGRQVWYLLGLAFAVGACLPRAAASAPVSPEKSSARRQPAEEPA